MKISSIYSYKINFKSDIYPKQAKIEKNSLDNYMPMININGNKKDGFTIFVDYKEAKDEEKLYTFKPDGSATCRSYAWGYTTTCPAGTFSKIYAELPNKSTDIKPDVAQKLVTLYKNNPNKSAIQITKYSLPNKN